MHWDLRISESKYGCRVLLATYIGYYFGLHRQLDRKIMSQWSVIEYKQRSALFALLTFLFCFFNWARMLCVCYTVQWFFVDDDETKIGVDEVTLLLVIMTTRRRKLKCRNFRRRDETYNYSPTERGYRRIHFSIFCQTNLNIHAKIEHRCRSCCNIYTYGLKCEKLDYKLDWN